MRSPSAAVLCRLPRRKPLACAGAKGAEAHHQPKGGDQASPCAGRRGPRPGQKAMDEFKRSHVPMWGRGGNPARRAIAGMTRISGRLSRRGGRVSEAAWERGRGAGMRQEVAALGCRRPGRNCRACTIAGGRGGRAETSGLPMERATSWRQACQFACLRRQACDTFRWHGGAGEWHRVPGR